MPELPVFGQSGDGFRESPHVLDVGRQAAPLPGEFPHHAIVRADARAPEPDALQNRHAETFDNRGLNGKRGFLVQAPECVVIDDSEPLHFRVVPAHFLNPIRDFERALILVADQRQFPAQVRMGLVD